MKLQWKTPVHNVSDYVKQNTLGLQAYDVNSLLQVDM